jgi:hypothetical protein
MMSGRRVVHSVPYVRFGAELVPLLASVLFLFAASSFAQDPGMAAAQAAQAAQQASQLAMQASQQANQQAAQAAQQASQQANEQAIRDSQAMMNSSTSAPRGNGRADKPRFYPASGKFVSATRVTIQDNVPKASLFYTLDGTEPTTSSTPYTGPVLISSTTRLKAIAWSPIYSPSRVASAKYVIK